MTVKIGEILARKYRLDALIGRGGMGQVFAATDLETQRSYALKVVSRERGYDRCAITDHSHGLRIADSSVFPEITNGNINAPSILVGEKAADMILGRAPLPAANLEPWINPDWRVAQR